MTSNCTTVDNVTSDAAIVRDVDVDVDPAIESDWQLPLEASLHLLSAWVVAAYAAVLRRHAPLGHPVYAVLFLVLAFVQ